MRMCVYPEAIQPYDKLIEDGTAKLITAVELPDPPAVVATLQTATGPRFVGMKAAVWIERL